MLGAVGPAWTRGEAEEFYRYYAVENADTDAVERLMELQGLHAQSYPTELIERFRTRFAGGHGSYPIVGTPDDVAGELSRRARAIHQCAVSVL